MDSSSLSDALLQDLNEYKNRMQDILLKANDLDAEVSKLQDEKSQLLEENQRAAVHLKKVIKECNRTKAAIGRISEDSESLISHLQEKDRELFLATEDVNRLREELSCAQELLDRSMMQTKSFEIEKSATIVSNAAELAEANDLIMHYAQRVDELNRRDQDKDDRIKDLEVENIGLRKGIGLLLNTNPQTTYTELNAAMLELHDDYHKILNENEDLLREINLQQELNMTLAGRDGEAKEIQQRLQRSEERIVEMAEELMAYKKLNFSSAERLEGLARKNSLLKLEVTQLRKANLVTLGSPWTDIRNPTLAIKLENSSHTPPCTGTGIPQDDDSPHRPLETPAATIEQDLDIATISVRDDVGPPWIIEGPFRATLVKHSSLDSDWTNSIKLGEVEVTRQSMTILHDAEPMLSTRPLNIEIGRFESEAEGETEAVLEPRYDEHQGIAVTKRDSTPFCSSSSQLPANPLGKGPALAINTIGCAMEAPIVRSDNVAGDSLPWTEDSKQYPPGLYDNFAARDLGSEDGRLVSEILRLQEGREDSRLDFGKQTHLPTRSLQRRGDTSVPEIRITEGDESRSQPEEGEQAAVGLWRRYNETLKNIEASEEKLKFALEREDQLRNMYSEFSSMPSKTFGTNVSSMAEALSVITSEYEDHKASLSKSQHNLIEEQQSTTNQKQIYRKLEEEHENLQQLSTTLQCLNDSLTLKLEMQRKELEESGNRCDYLQSVNQRMSQELEEMRRNYEIEVESLATERRERTKINMRYSELLRRDEGKSLELSDENTKLRKSLKEMKHLHKSTLIKLSEVESTHASLLRKIIAWGNPGPDEVINVDQINDSGPIEKSQGKSITRLFRAYLHQRWAVFTLR